MINPICSITAWLFADARFDGGAVVETLVIMVVAPYNVHVRLLRRTLAAGLADVPVGTVDKFQGREAALVFYSLATSSAEDVRAPSTSSSRATASTSPSRARCAHVRQFSRGAAIDRLGGCTRNAGGE